MGILSNKLKSYEKYLLTAILVSSSLVFLYTAGAGPFSATVQRALHWTFVNVALFLSFSVERSEESYKKIIDWFWVIIAIFSGVYILMTWHIYTREIVQPPEMEIYIGVLAIVLILEATRRTNGVFLTTTVSLFLLYCFMGPYMPGFLTHRGETLDRVVSFLFRTTDGVFGIPMAISSTYIIIFVIFGSFLHACGTGKLFIDFASGLTSRFRGGPAKTAIFASALMGMISGAPIANVVTTGTFTIPLMQKVGFTDEEAGAIEAAASTGSFIVPPIMGAAVFIMAQYLGIPYRDIIIPAIIPAFLYFLVLFLAVDALSVKRNLLASSIGNNIDVIETLRFRGHLSIPIVFLVYFIIIGWSPFRTAFWAIVILIIVSSMKKATRMSVKDFVNALERGSKNVIPVATACASAGIIVGVISLTGLGAKIASLMIEFSGGNVFLALFMTMISTIILGFGMPPTAVYIIISSLTVPSLVQLGVLPLSAHMFVFIFSCAAGLTPPVALTAFTAASISGGNQNLTGLKAFKLALIVFILPYMFVYSPALLLQGKMIDIVLSLATAIIGSLCLVIAIEGYLLVPWRWFSRILVAIAAILLIYGGSMTDMVGLLIIIIAVMLNFIKYFLYKFIKT